jgi:hypothetical protein
MGKVILAQYGTEEAPQELQRLADGPLLVYLGTETPINMNYIPYVNMRVLALVISNSFSIQYEGLRSTAVLSCNNS